MMYFVYKVLNERDFLGGILFQYLNIQIFNLTITGCLGSEDVIRIIENLKGVEIVLGFHGYVNIQQFNRGICNY